MCADGRYLLKNKIRAGLSFFNFFLNSNSFYLTLFMNFTNVNSDNKFFFLNYFSHFNLGLSFCKSTYRINNLKTSFLFGLNFLDFINLHKFFLEEASTFNNYTAGT